MKKTITIALLLFAMLLSSCDNTGEGTETSGTTVTTTAETTAEITTDAEAEEITAETTVAETDMELSIEKALEEYTVYESAFAKGDRGIEQYNLLFEEMFKKNKNGEDVPEYYAVRFAENRELAVVVHNMFDEDKVNITRVFYDGKWTECEMMLYAQQYAVIHDWGKIIYLELNGSSGVLYSYFIHDGIAEKIHDENKSYNFYEEDGQIFFECETVKYPQTAYPVPLFICEKDDFFRSYGKVDFKDGKIEIVENEKYTAYEYYMSERGKDEREAIGELAWDEYVQEAKKKYNYVG